MPKRVKVFFDGGCRGCPGTMEIAVVTGGRSTVMTDMGPGTSTDAEWLALTRALTVARELGLSDVVLIGDSADVVAKANGTVRCRGDELRRLEEVRSLAVGFARLSIRQIGRSRNLAGIALAALHPR